MPEHLNEKKTVR